MSDQQYGDKTGRYAFDKKGNEHSAPVEDKARVPFHPLDGILFATHHEGTHNVNAAENLAAWHERSAVHRALGDDRSEADVANHIRTIQWLADKYPELLGAAWKRYGNAAKHLPQLVKGSGDPTIVYSSKLGSRPYGPRMDALTDMVRPLVAVANTLLAKAGKAAPMGRHFEPFEKTDPADVPEKLPAPKPAIDEPVAKVDERRTVKAGKAKEAKEGKEARQFEPTIDNPQSAIPLAPDPRLRGGRFEAIHQMLKGGLPADAVVDALTKEPHGLSRRHAQASLRRYLASEAARRLMWAEAHKGPTKLARPFGPIGGDHDTLLAAARQTSRADKYSLQPDRNALAPLADLLHEHGHPNAALMAAAADRPFGQTRHATPTRGGVVWDAGDAGPHILFPPYNTVNASQLKENGTTDDYTRPDDLSPHGSTFWSSHHYTPQLNPDGVYTINVTHRGDVNDPRAREYGLPADYRSGLLFNVPVYSREDVGRLTASLHPAIRDYLQHWFARYGLPEAHEDEGPKRLARGAVGLDEMTKTGAIGGTALEYHLKRLMRGPDAKVANAARLALKLDRDRDLRGARDLMNLEDPYAYLGRLLAERGHKLAKSYNWDTMKDSLERDRMVEKLFQGARAKFAGGDRAFWDHMVKNFASGPGRHQAYDTIWSNLLKRMPGHTREQLEDSIHRIADRHLDREYLASVKEDVAARTRANKAVKQTPMLPAAHSQAEEASERRDETADPGSELHWRSVMNREPGRGALRFARDWEAISRKIKKLVGEGKDRRQAAAIAYDMERRGDLKKE